MTSSLGPRRSYPKANNVMPQVRGTTVLGDRMFLPLPLRVFLDANTTKPSATVDPRSLSVIRGVSEWAQAPGRRGRGRAVVQYRRPVIEKRKDASQLGSCFDHRGPVVSGHGV